MSCSVGCWIPKGFQCRPKSLTAWVTSSNRILGVYKNSPVDQNAQFLSILRKVDSQATIKLSQRPKYIFELDYKEESESKFHSIADTHGVMYAFHGSNVENFHSIVHNGLLNLFNKVSKTHFPTWLWWMLFVPVRYLHLGKGRISPRSSGCALIGVRVGRCGQVGNYLRQQAVWLCAKLWNIHQWREFLL